MNKSNYSNENYQEHYINRKQHNSSENTSGGIDLIMLLKLFLLGLKRFAWLVIILTVAFAAIGYGYIKMTFKPMYMCNTSFAAAPLIASDSNSGVSVYKFNYNATLASQMATTFPYILRSSILRDIVESDIGKKINGDIYVSAIDKTNVFEVTVVSSSKEDAYAIMTSLMKNYPKVAEYIIGDTRIKVISPAVKPEYPYNGYSKIKYTVAGALAGFALGCAFVLLFVFVRRTICTKNDIRVQLNQEYICELPLINKKRGSESNSLKSLLRDRTFTEAVRVLKNRTSEEFVKNNIKIVGVTSTMSGEGKTAVVFNLAKVFAANESKTIVVNMDPSNRNNPAIKNLFSDRSAKVADIVSGKIPLERAIVRNIINNVDMLPIRGEKDELDRVNYTKVFDMLREEYDRIIVDIPSVYTNSESVVITDFCDAYLYVVKCDYSSTARIKNSLNYLSFSKAKNLGVILNGVSGYYVSYGRYNQGRRYGYGYGYSYKYSHYSKYVNNKYVTNDNNNNIL